MKMTPKSRRGSANPIALLTAGAILVPTVLAGCAGGGGTTAVAPTSPPPGIGSTATRPSAGGMTGKQKMMVLAGAAALYYIYNKRKNASATQGQVQYYRSETSGRIYYRDPKTKQAIFVSPPTKPIQVPMEEAQQYQGYAGYNGQASGQPYGGFGYSPNGQYNQVPGAVPAEMF